MGARHPDRIPIADWRLGHESVAQMRKPGWEVISVCDGRCQVKTAVDLSVIEKISGPETSLWNRTQRCRTIGCTGMVHFDAKPPQRTVYDRLSAPWPGEPAG
jgi:hypothetical protein